MSHMTDIVRTLLVLDLDETLVFASETSLNHSHDHVVGPYFVYQRPQLQEFLFEVIQHFNLAVWSSSSPVYAKGIVQTVFPSQRKLNFVWGRDRCVQRYDGEWQATYYVKDFKKLKRQGYDLNRVLIVDDTPQKCERNYGNAIYVKPFFGDRNDSELERLEKYLRTLAACTNLRAIEKRNWRMQY